MFAYTFGSLKARIRKVLDRQDISDDDLQFGIYTAFQRIQRVTRLPSMEVSQTFTQPAGQDWITVYDNLLELKHVLVDAGPLQRKSLDWVVTQPAMGGTPKYFARADQIWQIYPVPEVDTEFTIIYYAEWDKLISDSAYNNLVIVAFDVLLYGALSTLGEDYVDERVPRWEERFQQEVAELAIQASTMEFAGSEMQVLPPEGSVY